MYVDGRIGVALKVQHSTNGKMYIKQPNSVNLINRNSFFKQLQNCCSHNSQCRAILFHISSRTTTPHIVFEHQKQLFREFNPRLVIHS